MSKTFVWWIQTSDWSRSSTRSPRVFPELSARLMGFLQPLTRGARVEDVWLIVCVSVCVTKYDINIIPPSLWNFFYLFYYWFIKCRFIRVMTFSDVKLQEMNQLLFIIYEANVKLLWRFSLFLSRKLKKNIFFIFFGVLDFWSDRKNNLKEPYVSYFIMLSVWYRTRDMARLRVATYEMYWWSGSTQLTLR